MNRFMQHGVEMIRDAIKRQMPDEPNFRRVRFSGGTENRVGEETGQTRDEQPFRAVRSPKTLRREWRAGTSAEQGDLEIWVLDDELLVKGDRVEVIDGEAAYEVTATEDFDWSGKQVGVTVTLEQQHD
jgi:hypothetical protein